MSVEPKGFSDKYAERFSIVEEDQDSFEPEEEHKASSLELLIFKITSYALMGIGVIALIGVMLSAWNIFINPASITEFAMALSSGATLTDDPSILVLAGWIMVVLLLLVIGKLAMYLIDAAIKINQYLNQLSTSDRLETD